MHPFEDLVEHWDRLTSKRGSEPRTGVQTPNLTGGQLSYTSGAVGCSIDGLIMDDDELAVGAQVNVQFEQRGTEFEALAKACKRVLRGVPHCSAMADDVRTAARRTELDTNHEAKASRIRRIYSRASSAESAIA